MLPPAIMDIVRERLGDRFDDYLLPSPVFIAMQGEFLEFDLDIGTLTTRFPVLDQFRNPYGSMQGGMLAAAVDNTIGPLSMMVAPLNVTRRLEMKYSLPVTPDTEYITVKSSLDGRKDSQLTPHPVRGRLFSAHVRDPQGVLLARAKATHWIVDDLLAADD
jgi:acyl-coenzyme A thioesterase PaaI-like protein